MSDRLPVQVEPLRLARQGAKLRGLLPLAHMQRLAEYLCGAAGDAEVALDFGLGEGGVGFLRGQARATLAMTCQRCLEPMDLEVEASFMFGLVESEGEAERVSEEYEPLTVGETPLRLAELVEDELILALPIVALHDQLICPAAGRLGTAEANVGDESGGSNPFAVLEQLKRKH